MKPIEAFLEGSEIPDLFEDDLESLANPLRKIAQMEGYQESIVSYFWQSNLFFYFFIDITLNFTTFCRSSV